MEVLLDSLWGLSNLLEKIALGAMLGGVVLVAWAIIKGLGKQEAERGDVYFSKVWRTGWAAVGLALLVIGFALDIFAIGVRMSAPGFF